MTDEQTVTIVAAILLVGRRYATDDKYVTVTQDAVKLLHAGKKQTRESPVPAGEVF